ncbi:conserved protein of unknown function [Nitrospira japonica]|uniref:DUF2630 domain-containing protein n=1 Tax=Nitrospira japonica TaxID=1325564 RepID=A0A1W1I309_9BACT|nr:DUF2630 family protein [Nitrospira japonica]SLM47382.1 conserved protein of unknown function [Nitrospira japonica]
MSDSSVLSQIETLVLQQHLMQGKESLSEDEFLRLRRIQVEIDQCWDLLRQRRALRSVGQDPDRAQVRPAEIVAKYRP